MTKLQISHQYDLYQVKLRSAQTRHGGLSVSSQIKQPFWLRDLDGALRKLFAVSVTWRFASIFCTSSSERDETTM
eukprot:4087120-Pleurochrysis_carterae.AAC.1